MKAFTGFFLAALIGLPLLAQSSGDSSQKEQTRSTEAVVGPGEYAYKNDPQCDPATNTQIDQIVKAYADSQVPGISYFAGDFLRNVSTQLGSTIKQNIRGTVGELLQPFVGDSVANCAVLTIAIPKGSKYTGYRLEARESGGQWQQCPTGMADCPIGWAAFREEPDATRGNHGGIIFVSTFKNWSHDRTREGRLTIFFVPPELWAPPR
jgi:hypothetical protein